jgi:hypothetical protein
MVSPLEVGKLIANNKYPKKLTKIATFMYLIKRLDLCFLKVK